MQSLHIDFKPSYQLTALLAGMSVTMIAILIVMPIVWYIKLAIALVVIANASYAIAKYAVLALPSSCIALKLTQQNLLEIMRKDGHSCIDLHVCADSVVTPYLTVIRLQQKNAPLLRRAVKVSIIVLADSTHADSFRKLRTWLRWGRR